MKLLLTINQKLAEGIWEVILQPEDHVHMGVFWANEETVSMAFEKALRDMTFYMAESVFRDAEKKKVSE